MTNTLVRALALAAARRCDGGLARSAREIGGCAALASSVWVRRFASETPYSAFDDADSSSSTYPPLRHREGTWPPLKRRLIPKPNEARIFAKEREVKRARKEHEEALRQEMDNYKPPCLLDILDSRIAEDGDSSDGGYAAFLSARHRLFSIKGSGDNGRIDFDKSMSFLRDGDSLSSVYTEHPDRVGVNPNLPSLQFAVVLLGGRQYRVMKDDSLASERLPFVVGERVRLERVLLVGSRMWTVFGRPLVHAASVDALVTEQSMSKQIDRMFWGKSRRRRRYSHAQYFTRLHIDAINYTPPTLEQLEPLKIQPGNVNAPARQWFIPAQQADGTVRPP